jgi:GNAT superfamily N-acetyltransferase
MMTGETRQLEIEVLPATETLDVYKSREYWEEQFKILGLWPEMLGYGLISQRYSAEIDRNFLRFQLVAVLRSDSNRVVGIAHAVPLHTGGDIGNLSDRGWDWALETAVLSHTACTSTDTICGLSITVLPEFQRRGVGKMLIEAVVLLAVKRGFQNVIMPARPISKQKWPFLSMSEFLTWRHYGAFHDDPWIRAHERAGGFVAGVCSRSMTIAAPLSEWERWCERRFSESGNYPVRGCLAPVKIDVDKDMGFYEEPNVWVVHPCSTSLAKGDIYA